MSAARSARTGSSSLTRPPAEGRGHCGGGRAPSRPRRLRRQLQGRGAGKALGDRAVPPFGRRRSDGRDKANLDIFWLRDESLEDTDNLPAPGVIAAEIVEDLQSALAEFTELAESLHGIDVEIEEERMDTEVRTPQLVVMQPQRSSCRFQRPYVWNQENQWGPLCVTLRPHHHSLPSVAGRRGNRRCHGRTGTRSSTSWRRTTRVNHVQERP